MADLELGARERTAGVQWGQFIVALIVLVLLIFGLVSARDEKMSAMETRITDSHLPDMRERMTRIEDKESRVESKLDQVESKLDELLRRRR